MRYIKKLQFDHSFFYFYSLNCSLVHLIMAVGVLFVRWPNRDKAKLYDDSFTPLARSYMKLARMEETEIDLNVC